MTNAEREVSDAVRYAFNALKRSDHLEARRWAETAARLDPDRERTYG